MILESKMSSKIRILGYARVSTASQADLGVSLEAQQEKLTAMAVVHGGELVEIIADAGESAKDLDRPGVQRLLALVEARAVDAIYLTRLDRLTRSVADLARLMDILNRRGVTLVSAAESLDTSSASGRLVLNVLTAFSQFEREAISTRTKTALNFKRSRGERVGELPFGFTLGDDNIHIVPDAGEQAIAVAASELRSHGCTHRRIAEELNQRGYRTRNGTGWRSQYVPGLLKASGASTAA